MAAKAKLAEKPKPNDVQLHLIKDCRKRLEAGKGLTIVEWKRFDFLEKKFFPDAFKRRQDEVTRNWNLKHARKLSLEDLQMLVAEKQEELKANDPHS